MPQITLDAYDAEARGVTFTAYGQQKTITGLGEFASQKGLVEFLESVAETDMKPAATLTDLPDMQEFVGETLPEASTLPEPAPKDQPL